VHVHAQIVALHTEIQILKMRLYVQMRLYVRRAQSWL